MAVVALSVVRRARTGDAYRHRLPLLLGPPGEGCQFEIRGCCAGCALAADYPPVGVRAVGVSKWESRVSAEDSQPAHLRQTSTRMSGRAAVLVDESAEDINALDAASNGHRGYRCGSARERRPQTYAAVRAAGVVMLQVSGQNTLQVVSVPDQRPVQAPGPDGTHPSFGVRVRLRRPRWDFDGLDSSRGEDGIEHGDELGIPATDQKPQPMCVLVKVHQQIYRQPARPTRRSGAR